MIGNNSNPPCYMGNRELVEKKKLSTSSWITNLKQLKQPSSRIKLIKREPKQIYKTKWIISPKLNEKLSIRCDFLSRINIAGVFYMYESGV